MQSWGAASISQLGPCNHPKMLLHVLQAFHPSPDTSPQEHCLVARRCLHKKEAFSIILKNSQLTSLYIIYLCQIVAVRNVLVNMVLSSRLLIWQNYYFQLLPNTPQLTDFFLCSHAHSSQRRVPPAGAFLLDVMCRFPHFALVLYLLFSTSPDCSWNCAYRNSCCNVFIWSIITGKLQPVHSHCRASCIIKHMSQSLD